MSRAYPRRHVLQVIAALPLGTALLAACGGTQSTVATSTSTGAATSAPVSSASAASVAATTSKSAASAASSVATTSTAATTAAASGGAKPTPTPEAGQSRRGAATTVELWLNWSGDVYASMVAMTPKIADGISAFNVSWLTASNNGTKLPVAIAAGTPPDAAAGGITYPEYWARGYATQVDDLVGKSKVITKSDIPDSAWHYAGYKGKTYGIPAIEAFCRYGLCLDMTNLQKFGVDPKSFSSDWDTIAQLQQQVTQKSGGGIDVLGIDPLSEDGVSNLGAGFYIGQAWGIDYFDETKGTYNFANEPLADAMTTMKKLYDLAGGADAIATWRKNHPQWIGSNTAAIPSGAQDLSIIGYFAPGQVVHFAPNRSYAFTWAPAPASRKGFRLQCVGGHSLLIPSGAKHVADAFQLIEFMVDETAQQILFDQSGFLGARLSFLSKVDTSKYPGLDWYFSSVKNADKVSGPVSDPIQSFSADRWTAALQDVLTGKSQPQAALAQLQQQVTDEYKRRFPNG